MQEDTLITLDKQLRKVFGASYTGRHQNAEPIVTTPTGLPSLDWVLGGGIPRGRIIELYGAQSSGKSTLALHLINLYQRQGRTCALVDAESAYSERYAQQLGLDTSELMLVESNRAEEVLNSLRLIVEAGVELVVIDSVAALTTAAEAEKDIGDNTVASLARLMSTALKQLASSAGHSGTTLLFLNQIRAANLGGYGPPKDTPGGNALKFYASLRLSMTRAQTIEKAGDTQGIISTLKAEKNKIGIPFRKCNLSIYLPPTEAPLDEQVYGVDLATDLIEWGIRYGVLVKNGAWYSYPQLDFKCQGFDGLRQAILDNQWIPHLQEDIQLCHANPSET